LKTNVYSFIPTSPFIRFIRIKKRSIIMKTQTLISLLPLLAGLAAAIPAANPGADFLHSAEATSLSDTDSGNTTLTLSPNEILDDADSEDEAFIEVSDDELIDPSDPAWLSSAEDSELAKRGVDDTLHLEARPNIKFRIGKSIRAHATLTLYKDGRARFYTRMNNRRHFGPYKYGVSCGVQDREGRVFSFERTGKVCRVRKSCHVETKDTTVHNANVKRYWIDIMKGSKKLVCTSDASWDIGKVASKVIKWFEDNKKRVLEVIAVVKPGKAAA
jgi:hypothetical protein